ncbi:MAG: PHP domain-containing protein [Chloroflexi bacterium]|nr:PHP domain-containing protein [Chloroflexota bacterium]
MSDTPGLAFKKLDLHIHTPKSLCYSERSATLEQIVDSALASRLDAIGITDHNTAAAIDGIREIARKKHLFVFPGMEISTREGHILAIFELDIPSDKLDSLLDYVRVPKDGRGDATVPANDAMEEVFQKVVEQGGLAIAAHIERWPSGFLETNEPRGVKTRIHNSQYLSALEITIPQNKDSWNFGKMPGYEKRHACIQASDAHALAEIGRRTVYVKMERVGLDALRSAFIDYGTKILFHTE